MRRGYKAIGNRVIFQSHDGEENEHAVCFNAEAAARFLNEAIYLNDSKRAYTGAARLQKLAEELPGFRWTN